MNGPSQPVSFRLAAEYANEIDRRAKQAGVSRGDYARQIVLAGLTNDTAEETRNRVAEIQEEVQRLREELLSSVNALLVYAGKVDKEQARNFVRNTLMK